MMTEEHLEQLEWVSATRPLTREEAWNLIQEAKKAQAYKKALQQVKGVALNNDDYSLVADTQRIVIEIVDEAIKE